MGLIDDLRYTQRNLNIIRTKTTLVNNESLERVAKAVNNMELDPYLQNKSVLPSNVDIEVLPDDVYLALAKVTVLGDSSLVADNIKLGTSIFGVEGSVNPEPPLQVKTESASSEHDVVIEADSPNYGLSKVIIYKVKLLDTNVSPADTEVVVEPSGEYMGLRKVVISPIQSGEITAIPTFRDGDTFILTPDTGTYFNKVTINKDPNLIPDNIKKGVIINGVKGTYIGEGYNAEVEDGVLSIDNVDVENEVLDI